MAPVPWRIEAVTAEVADGEVFTWSLSPLESQGEPLPQPGQFNMLYLFGIGEAAISVSGIPGRDGTGCATLSSPPPLAGGVVHTIRAVGSVTRAMQALSAGTVIGLRGPFGSCWPVAAAEGRDLILVAGGIGLAPLRPVLHEIAARRRSFGRVLLCYGARSPRDLIFRSELERWEEECEIELRIAVDRGTAAWSGHVGVVTELLDRGGFSGRNALAMICGPEIMMDYSVQALRRRGVPKEAIFVSMERSMRCAVGFCGHCQIGADFVCRDGPVFPYPRMEPAFRIQEL
ncbi:Ni/Fe hydrogenase subunit gamma [Halorhodospira abdelmalekii]|uniref:FAD/NAD(P)-binding protein n=1 Tax=Halorhodospira abdelmalekii TaxID=421629 RepID=UPI00190436A7|nr:FAD/NAD(P)-binding protein [Halorhodospira abdelmalekii]MBK1735996.1 Ni/Fe hydrogenase subunit gamma [Halorhodospira abdelmalekii]